MENRRAGLDGDVACRIAGDEAGDGRNSHHLRGRTEARISAPASARADAVAGDDCAAAGSGGPRLIEKTTAAMDCARNRQAQYIARVVEFLFSSGGDGAGHDGPDSDLSRGAAPGTKFAQCAARRDGCHASLVAGRCAVWNLRAARALQYRVRRVGGGDRPDHLDAAFRRDHISGCGLERGAGGKPQGGPSQCLTRWCRWSAIPAIRRTCAPCSCILGSAPSNLWCLNIAGIRAGRLTFARVWRTATATPFAMNKPRMSRAWSHPGRMLN